MTDHLCLKWNNHSTSFVKYISKIQIDEKFCDATITSQGKYFPVHRIVLSTCSDYFAEIFERMQSPHPYIVFKDIDPSEMELLLTYMYKGEVNVTQDLLPSLIKAAEALKIKGLAVPDDVASTDSSSGKKRNSASDHYSTKRKLDESKRRRNSDSVNVGIESTKSEKFRSVSHENNASDSQLQNNEVIHIKQEPVDISEDQRKSEFDHNASSFSNEQFEDSFQYSSTADTSRIKCEENYEDVNSFEDQSVPPLWINTADVDNSQIHSSEASAPQDMFEMIQKPLTTNSKPQSQVQRNISQQIDDQLALTIPGRSKPTKSTNLAFHCPYCDYTNRFKSKINRHMLFKHSNEKPYSCSFCSKSFVEKVAQQRHMRLHTGEKPFGCQLCFKKFGHKVNLKYHLENNLCRKSC